MLFSYIPHVLAYNKAVLGLTNRPRFNGNEILLHTNNKKDRLGKLSLAVFKRSGPLVISAKPVFDSGQERRAEFYLFLVVLCLTGTGRGVEPEKMPKKTCFQVRKWCFFAF